eukprot:gene9667-10494_t
MARKAASKPVVKKEKKTPAKGKKETRGRKRKVEDEDEEEEEEDQSEDGSEENESDEDEDEEEDDENDDEDDEEENNVDEPDEVEEGKESVPVKKESSSSKPAVKKEVKIKKEDEFIEDRSNWKVGQKFPTPSPGNGDRVFYETLYQQRPDSEMAQEWCIAYGILEPDQAKKLYEKIQRRKSGKVESPVKSSKTASASKASAKAPPAKPANTSASKRRKVVVEDDIEGDTGMEGGSAWEGSGTVGV